MNEYKSLSLIRNSNNITISEYLENHDLEKYNYSPKYQRNGAVWNTEQKAFLMDSIFKNYPLPPIFLRSKLDKKTGKTTYDVIDGKQRLETIRDFVVNKFSLPENFGDDSYGSEILNGLTFGDIQELSGADIDHFKNNFWNYSIPIEYIKIANEEEEKVVHTIFDRLNRNGEPLNEQELRNSNAEYYDLIKVIKRMKNKFWQMRLSEAVSLNRMEDDEFLSELFFTLLENKWIDSSPEKIDELYKKWSEKIDEIQVEKVLSHFFEISNFMESLDIDYDGYKIKGVSHLYGIWGVSKYCVEENISVSKTKPIIIKFYDQLRKEPDKGENVLNYKNSMASATRSVSKRKKRIEALVAFIKSHI